MPRSLVWALYEVAGKLLEFWKALEEVALLKLSMFLPALGLVSWLKGDLWWETPEALSL